MKMNSKTFKYYYLIIAGLIVCKASYSQEIDSLISIANEQYKSNAFIQAAKNYNKAYKLNKKDRLSLYYAATSAVTGKDYTRALSYYLELDSLNYTGIVREYFAKNVKSKKQDEFDTKAERNLAIKKGTHKKRKNKWSTSKKIEIAKNIALIYVNIKDNRKALTAIKKARIANRKDFELLKIEASISYSLGLNNEFYSLLKEGLKIDKKDTNFIYNLGVLSHESRDFEIAKKYYLKVLKFDPNHIDALTNLSALVLKNDADIIEEMNGLGMTKNDNKRYVELSKRRKESIKKAVSYLETIIKIDTSKTEVLHTLINLYQVLGDGNKQKEIKALLNK